ncbi:MAG: pilus assembly PilX N-terminal domain-containing protein, partial [candidate division Zixibacteria bacterium]|nr:pilus assembly PilX N-terminal domain-containing protein [candidate division Zixibacteria bacterium]
MKNIFKNESGSALIITLSLLMVLSLIGLMSVKTSHTDVELSFNKQHNEKSFYNAEAGANRALVDLCNNNNWDSGYVSIALNDGTYDVVIRNIFDNPA